jgi:hypothetical protein
MKVALTITLLLMILPAAADDTLRCGSKIVRIGMTMTEVKKYCGNPSSTSIEEQAVHAGPRVVGTTQIHTWRYNRSTGQKTAVLEFDLEKLKSIIYENK